MATLTTYDYCVDCPYFRVHVNNCKTPEEFIALMNQEEDVPTRCEYSYICDRVYRYVREKCEKC